MLNSFWMRFLRPIRSGNIPKSSIICPFLTMTIIQKLLFEGFFPSQNLELSFPSHTESKNRKDNYEGNQAMTAISYTDFTHSYSWIYLSFARLMRSVCFLNWFLLDYTHSMSKKALIPLITPPLKLPF